MRRVIATVLLVIAIALFPKIIFSQNFDFNKALSDYTYNYSLYRQAEGDYQLARNQYLTYKTLASREKAVEATRKVLILRDEAIKTYITAIRMKLSETVGVNDNDKNLLSSQVEADIKWFSDHKDNISSAATLDDLQNSNNMAKDHYRLTELTIYKTLMATFTGKEDNLRGQIASLRGETDLKVEELRKNGDKNTQAIERWLIEVENRLVRSQERQSEAIKRINRLEAGNDNKFDVYNETRFTLSEAHQYLKEASSFLKEVMREIKTAD